jgi:anti-sigma B factor antagonist
MKRPTKFWTRRVDSVNIVDVTGRLAPEGTDDALFKLVSNLVEKGEKRFLVDMSSTTFISSLGVGSLLRSARAVEGAGGRLKLLNPSQSVARILELSRMTDVFQIFVHEQEAVASFDTDPDPVQETETEPEPEFENEPEPEEESETPKKKPAAKKAAAKPRKPRKKAGESDEE